MKGWNLYPIWGLELQPNGIGLERPIFGDATLVTREFVAKLAPNDPRLSAILSGSGLRALLESQGATHAATAPIERLIDIAPGAFIAVRRSDQESALRYAECICALLTGSAVLTSGEAKGFSLSPLALHWATIPGWVRLNKGGELQSDYKVIISSFINQIPLAVSHRQLSDSWTRNDPVAGTWRLYSQDHLSRALVGDRGTSKGLGNRIRDASVILTKAMASTDPALSTIFATVALETLLKSGASAFAELEEMATCIFSGDRGPAELSRLIGNRHRAAHEAKPPASAEEHVQEIAAAWVLVNMAAIAAANGLDASQYLDHLRGRVEARRVAARLRLLGRNDLADEVEQAATHLPTTDKGKSK